MYLQHPKNYRKVASLCVIAGMCQYAEDIIDYFLEKASDSGGSTGY